MSGDGISGTLLFREKCLQIPPPFGGGSGGPFRDTSGCDDAINNGCRDELKQRRVDKDQAAIHSNYRIRVINRGNDRRTTTDTGFDGISGIIIAITNGTAK